MRYLLSVVSAAMLVGGVMSGPALAGGVHLHGAVAVRPVLYPAPPVVVRPVYAPRAVFVGPAYYSAPAVVAPTYYPAAEYVVAAPPPLPIARVEVLPARPGPAYVWVGGEWAWRGPHGYAWVPGRWVIPGYRGVAWVHGHWANGHGGHRWVEGHWHR